MLEKGISIGDARIAQLVKKEIPLSIYRVTDTKDPLRLNNN